MRKTRFFYEYQFLLAVLLGWLSLCDCAMARQVQIRKSELQEKREELYGQKNPGEKETDQEAAQSADTQKQEVTPEKSELEKETDNIRPEDTEIRVVLTDSDFQNIYHDTVAISLNGKEMVYEAEKLKQNEEVISIPEQDTGISIPSIHRQCGTPAYRGRIEIHPKEEGLLLLNILPLEEYLEAVVPSEMPSTYEMEALKAQAICARTYAWKQMQGGRLSEYGADVDDSVSYQVYQNVAPQESTNKAIEETKGIILSQNGQPVEAYYFSTSAGITSTDEIWGSDRAAAYLKSVPCEFDSEEPWSAWSVKIPRADLEEKASSVLGLDGKLKAVTVRKKSQSGAVTELSVTTESGSEELNGEYDIREFLSPKNCQITEKDGSITKGGMLLPSAYFEIMEQNDEGITLKGGGYGHGVGMSQTAANEMAKEGYTHKEILDYFFRDIEFESIY